MIPARDLSLLSNRLAAGGRRLPETVLERDYCLAWFLVALARTPLREALVFKGGTALKRCWFGDYRSSEDLDFTLAREMDFETLKARLEPVYAEAARATGAVFRFPQPMQWPTWMLSWAVAATTGGISVWYCAWTAPSARDPLHQPQDSGKVASRNRSICARTARCFPSWSRLRPRDLGSSLRESRQFGAAGRRIALFNSSITFSTAPTLTFRARTPGPVGSASAMTIHHQITPHDSTPINRCDLPHRRNQRPSLAR